MLPTSKVREDREREKRERREGGGGRGVGGEREEFIDNQQVT